MKLQTPMFTLDPGTRAMLTLHAAACRFDYGPCLPRAVVSAIRPILDCNGVFPRGVGGTYPLDGPDFARQVRTAFWKMGELNHLRDVDERADTTTLKNWVNWETGIYVSRGAAALAGLVHGFDARGSTRFRHDLSFDVNPVRLGKRA